MKFNVVDSFTGQIMGTYLSRKTASRKADKLDNEYGFEYRTDGKIVEGHDGKHWNKTGSLEVVLTAKKVWKDSIESLY